MRISKCIVTPYKNTIALCSTYCFFSTTAISQKNSIKGVVLDTTEKKKLPYAIVALINLKDTTLYQSQRTTGDGSFEINKIIPGKYRLMISYPRKKLSNTVKNKWLQYWQRNI